MPRKELREFTAATLPDPRLFEDSQAVLILPGGARSTIFSDGQNWVYPGGLDPLTKEPIATEAAEFRALGGRVVAHYYPEWRTDQKTNSYNRWPHSWIRRYPDRIPLAAMAIEVPRAFVFSGYSTAGIYGGSNTSIVNGAQFTAIGVGTTTITVTAVTEGALAPGQWFTGAGVAAGTTIVSQISGATGGPGDYQINSAQTFPLITCTTLGLLQTGTGSDPSVWSPSNLNIDGGQVKGITIKLKRLGGTTGWDGTFYFATTEEGIDAVKSFPITQPTWSGTATATIEIDIPNNTTAGRIFSRSTIKSFRIDFGNSASDAFLIESIEFRCAKDYITEMALPGQESWAVDWELQTAFNIGVDVFAVCFYWWANNTNPGAHALDLMESSTVTQRPKHCITWANHDLDAVQTQANLNLMLDNWNTRFANPNYWRINGKPVVFIVDYGMLGKQGVKWPLFLDGTAKSSSDPAGTRDGILYIQTRLKTLGNAPDGVHLVMCGQAEHPFWTGRKSDWVGRLESYGAAAASAYSYRKTYVSVTQGGAAVSGGTVGADFPNSSGATTYQQLVDVGIQRNKLIAQSGTQIPHWPCVMSGFDSRPWSTYSLGAFRTTWNTNTTPREFRRALRDAVRSAVASHKSLPQVARLVPVITIYAWNELGEGGWIVPTLGRGYQISECVAAIAGVAA